MIQAVNSDSQTSGLKNAPFSDEFRCCYNQLLSVMAEEVGGSKNGSFQNQASPHPAAINGGEQAKGHSVLGHRCSRQKLRGVTSVLVRRHGGCHRAKLKSIARGPAALLVRVQQT